MINFSSLRRSEWIIKNQHNPPIIRSIYISRDITRSDPAGDYQHSVFSHYIFPTYGISRYSGNTPGSLVLIYRYIKFMCMDLFEIGWTKRFFVFENR